MCIEAVSETKNGEGVATTMPQLNSPAASQFSTRLGLVNIVAVNADSGIDAKLVSLVPDTRLAAFF